MYTITIIHIIIVIILVHILHIIENYIYFYLYSYRIDIKNHYSLFRQVARPVVRLQNTYKVVFNVFIVYSVAVQIEIYILRLRQACCRAL